MISFIIIGRNEGWKLTKCISSVIKTIEKNQLQDSEIIYVDSDSGDDSIERVKAFNKVSIFSITGIYNAAIARNIGALESKGDILFFIDGDMEINPDFINYVIENNLLKYEFATGELLDRLFDKNWNFLNSQSHYKSIEKPKFIYSTGGIFLIKRNLWFSVKGMKTKYRRAQDKDFTLRLIKQGYKLLRLNKVIAWHNTIPHTNKHRMWFNVRKLNIFFSKSVLTRDHIFNRYFYPEFIRQNYSSVILFSVVILSIMLNHITALFIYGFLIFIRSISNTLKENKRINLRYLFSRYFYILIVDILSIALTFIFFPTSIKVKYEKIK